MPETSKNLKHRLFWFALYWVASVLALTVVAQTIRFAIL